MTMTLFRKHFLMEQNNSQRPYRPKIAGILFVCNDPAQFACWLACLQHQQGQYRTMLLFGTECAACDSVLWKREIFWMYTLTLCSILLIKYFIFHVLIVLLLNDILDVRGFNCFWSSPFDFADRGTRYKDDSRDNLPLRCQHHPIHVCCVYTERPTTNHARMPRVDHKTHAAICFLTIHCSSVTIHLSPQLYNIIPKKHSSAPNLKSPYRSAMPRKQRTVATHAYTATPKPRQGSPDITVK